MAELLNRMGSAEIAEWVVELGVLRPEDEKEAMEKAEKEAAGQKTLGPRPLTRAELGL